MTDFSHFPPSHFADSSDSVADLSDSSFVSWSKTVYFLSVTLEMEREFQSIEYAASGMFDLSHTETVKQLELRRSVQTVNCKVQIASSMLKWLAANRGLRTESTGDISALLNSGMNLPPSPQFWGSRISQSPPEIRPTDTLREGGFRG